MKKMNPEVKKLWVEALLSGEYKQGFRRLRNANNEFCCLGVLCNLHAQLHPKLAGKQLNPNTYFGNDKFLPQVVQDWAGVTYNGKIWEKPIRFSLAGLNDDGGSFETAAYYIEKYL